MSGTFLARLDMTLLIPELIHAFVDLATQLQARTGICYRAYSGYRAPAEQAVLHNAWLQGHGGKAASPWQSAHQWGIAIDVQPYNPGPTWEDGAYLPLWQALATHPTLRSGAEFGDGPHIELRHPAGAWSAARLAALPRIGASDLVGRAWPMVRTICNLAAEVGNGI